MFFQHHFRKTTAILGLFGLLVFLPGCPLSPDSDDSGGGTQDTRLVPRNTISDTIKRQAQIWELKKYPEYDEILHDAFEFYVRDDDADLFPWLQNEPWTKTIELEIAANMFDEGFSGDELPVDTIQYSYTELNQTDIRDGEGNVIGTTVKVNAVVQILVGPDDGWIATTGLEFDVVPDPDEPGLFQIIRQAEFDQF